jgi:hypothetical protein
MGLTINEELLCQSHLKLQLRSRLLLCSRVSWQQLHLSRERVFVTRDWRTRSRSGLSVSLLHLFGIFLCELVGANGSDENPAFPPWIASGYSTAVLLSARPSFSTSPSNSPKAEQDSLHLKPLGSVSLHLSQTSEGLRLVGMSFKEQRWSVARKTSKAVRRTVSCWLQRLLPI